MKRFISAALAAGMIASSLLLAACNKETQNENTGDQSQITSTASQISNQFENQEESIAEISVNDAVPEMTSSQISQMSKELDSYKKVPEFATSEETVDAHSLTEKLKLMVIPDNSDKTYTDLVIGQVKNAASMAGFKEDNVDIKTTDGTVSAVSDALNSAIEKKSDAVVMFGDIDKDNVSTAIETVQANGIEVISSGCAGKGIDDHFVDNTMPVDYQLAGKIMADWTLVKKNGKVNALAVNQSDSALSNTIYSGFAEEFKKYVSTATGYCTTVNGTAVEVGNGFSAKIKDELTKDPNINYIIVFDDAMISDAVSAVSQANSKAKVIATGGSKEAFDMAQSGNIEMLVAHSYEWIGYATIDYALRVMTGSKLPTDQNVPFRIVDADIIKKALAEDTDDADGFYQICFGAAFVDGYKQLWGLEYE